MIRRLLSWWRRDDAVSRLWLLQHAQGEGKDGVDLPTWRTPREIKAMRRAERKQAMRRVA
jgi:hypothetical protein